jgi:peptidyl-tRNA hydrolase
LRIIYLFLKHSHANPPHRWPRQSRPEYEQTRHNAGFWLVDNLANDSGARLQRESKYNAMFAKASIAGRKCICWNR